MIEKEKLVEFIDGIVTKDELGEMMTIEQVEEINRKLVARLDVQQGQLDGLQSLIGAMQVKITQMQLQLVKMEERLAEKAANIAPVESQESGEHVSDKAPTKQEQTKEEQPEKKEPVEEEVAKEKPVKEETKAKEEPVIEKPVEAKTAIKEKVREHVETSATAGTQTIADAIKGEESLAEKLSKNVGHETVASSLNSSKIERIQTAITIADRFRFQRELFAGDAVKMAETLEMLNKMKSFDEAVAYIDKLFNWDLEQQVTKDFIRIIERRF